MITRIIKIAAGILVLATRVQTIALENETTMKACYKIVNPRNALIKS